MNSLEEIGLKNALIEALALGNKTKTQIAEDLNISRTTIYTYLNQPDFVSDVNKQKERFMRDRQSAANNKLCSYIDQAIENIAAIANNPDTPPATRLSANVEILNRTLGKASSGGELRPSTTYNINSDNRKVINNNISDILKKLNKDGE